MLPLASHPAGSSDESGVIDRKTSAAGAGAIVSDSSFAVDSSQQVVEAFLPARDRVLQYEQQLHEEELDSDDIDFIAHEGDEDSGASSDGLPEEEEEDSSFEARRERRRMKRKQKRSKKRKSMGANSWGSECNWI